MKMYLLAGLFTFIGTISQVTGQAAPVFDLANDGDLSKLLSQGIQERTPKGTVLGQLRAYVSDNPNANVMYRGISQTLSVTSDGIVSVNRELDREAATQSGNDLQARWSAYYLYQGVEVETISTVTIQILDINDNPPGFLNVPYSAQIPEDTTVGSTVFSRIRIFDPDIGIHAEIKLDCYINPDDQQTVEACDYFELTTQQLNQGNYSGAIVLKKDLDYELRKGFTMTIQAKDNPNLQGGAPSLNTTINVLLEIGDQQDTPPFFTDTPITIFVEENQPVGRVVHSVSAKDGDEGSPRPIKIINKAYDPAQLFRVGDAVKVGENTWASPVIINNPIDREVLQARYQFVVEAIEMDNGNETDQTQETTITVNIQDVDDNQPMFEFSTYEVNVTEMDTQTAGATTLPGLTMRVTDPDDASFAQFNVGINSAVPYDNFLVSPDNGVGSALISLTIKNPSLLNYEIAQDRKQIVNLTASDARNASRVSHTMVTINLLDANDNYPDFALTSYLISAREDLAVGQPMGTITGTDKDSGLNGELSYSLSGTGADVFTVNSVSGEVTLAKPLDFESTPRYELLFIATDKGASPRQKSVPLSIEIINFNDFGPVFNPPSYRTSIRETDTVLLIPVTVQATDKESGNNVTYRIVSGNTPNPVAFILGLQTGALSVTRAINYEETPNNQGYFTLIIEATDADQPPQKTNTTIIVEILDENNHNPIFNPTLYTKSISEIDPSGTYITTVTATDNDFGSNGNMI